ncbi:MAG: FHA domain-containing protein [Desulfobacteraceae bacterium]|nr:FHA domain-containing protein [Desulfobacteraceae bacterium]
MARLILEFNQEVLRDYPVRSRSITIGRQEDNTIVLDNPRVSGYHARIDRAGFDYILTDLQSTNGTFVNNENVVSQKLLHGDRIRIGEHILLFVGTEKAKVEAETENIPLNQTVIIGVKPKGREVTPLPEIERPEFGIREVKSPRPYRRITPIFLAILIVIAGGWLLLSHGPFLMRMIFERTSSSGTVGDASKISDGEPINSRMDRAGPLTKKILEKPGASSPQEEDSSLTTSGDSEPAVGPRDELVETSDPAVAEALYEDRFKLDGIVWSSDAEQSFAVINGTILKVGGSVEGAVVTDIGRNYVLLKSREDDSEIKLTIR